MIRIFDGDDPPPGWDDGDNHDGPVRCIDHNASGCEDCTPCPQGCGLTTVAEGADHCASYCEACIACDCPPDCVGCNGCEPPTEVACVTHDEPFCAVCDAPGGVS